MHIGDLFKSIMRCTDLFFSEKNVLWKCLLQIRPFLFKMMIFTICHFFSFALYSICIILLVKYESICVILLLPSLWKIMAYYNIFVQMHTHLNCTKYVWKQNVHVCILNNLQWFYHFFSPLIISVRINTNNQ